MQASSNGGIKERGPLDPDLPRGNDLCFAVVFGPWGGVGRRHWKGLGIWGLNLGFVGFRVWRGDLPSIIVNEVANLAKAAGGTKGA